MPQTAKYGIGQFSPWKHWHMKFTVLGLFKIISCALTIFPRMFECPDKFIPFTPYLFVSCMIFLNFDGSLHFGQPLLNQHGDPQFFFAFFQMIYPYRHLWKFYKNHIGTSAPNLLRYDHYAPDSQIWYWLFLPVKQWREQKSSQNHFWHNDSVCPDVWAHSEVHCLPTSRVNRKNLSEIAHVLKGTLIIAILKTNMVTPNFFAFSDRKWTKKCLYQIWAKSYRFWKFIETAANLLKARW